MCIVCVVLIETSALSRMLLCAHGKAAIDPTTCRLYIERDLLKRFPENYLVTTFRMKQPEKNKYVIDFITFNKSQFHLVSDTSMQHPMILNMFSPVSLPPS